MPQTDQSVVEVLETIRTRYPETPFLALGQTVFWDEPTKAVWRRLLDTHLPDAKLIAGVHDTDYFAKTSAHVYQDGKYAILEHDDGRTQGLWSAAGELSALFGSESVPSRQMYLEHGVPFDWIAKTFPGGKAELYKAMTTAWGWTGIVHTEQHSIIAHDIPVIDIKDTLLEQLDWGFTTSLGCLEDERGRASATAVAAEIRGWLENFLNDCNRECRLSDLYQTLLPRFYQLLLGAPPNNFNTTSSTQLFQFNSATCNARRFEIVDHFLNPLTRDAAQNAYNSSVGRSGIYTLDSFGAGAIPFDLVMPKHGRGTIRITDTAVIIETAPHPVQIPTPSPIKSVQELAAAVEKQYGQGASLVGKAIILPDMIAAEFLVLFHETASGYTNLTADLNHELKAAGIAQNLFPIVRISYPTWDEVSAAPDGARFRLPPHFAAAFGAPVIAAQDFAHRWREVVRQQRQILKETPALHKVRDLIAYLEKNDPECWCNQLTDYDRALTSLANMAAKSAVLKDRIVEHRDQIRVWQNERHRLETRKGEDWRQHMLPLLHRILSPETSDHEREKLQQQFDRQTAIRETAFDEQIYTVIDRIRATKVMNAQFQHQRRLMERGEESKQARATVREITLKAQTARMRIVHDAFLTVEGLEHTQPRPTSWWLPLVDPTGEWFNRIVHGTKARFEYLTAD